MICVSSWLPAVDVTEPTLIALTNAASPVMHPAATKTRIFVVSTRIPANLAAVSPAPIAFSLEPSPV